MTRNHATRPTPDTAGPTCLPIEIGAVDMVSMLMMMQAAARAESETSPPVEITALVFAGLTQRQQAALAQFDAGVTQLKAAYLRAYTGSPA